MEVGDGSVEYDHCTNCRLMKLEDAFAGERGQRIQNAQEICAALTVGFQVDWQDLAADQFLAVAILHGERQRFEREEMEARQHGG